MLTLFALTGFTLHTGPGLPTPVTGSLLHDRPCTWSTPAGAGGSCGGECMATAGVCDEVHCAVRGQKPIKSLEEGKERWGGWRGPNTLAQRDIPTSEQNRSAV